MSIADIAKEFTELLKQHDHKGAAAKFNSDDIVSYEPMQGPMAEIRGKEAVAKKGEWWFANHEVHGGTISGPYVNGDQFMLESSTDITVKESGQRMQLSELSLYTVKDGKIVSERFFMK